MFSDITSSSYPRRGFYSPPEDETNDNVPEDEDSGKQPYHLIPDGVNPPEDEREKTTLRANSIPDGQARRRMSEKNNLGRSISGGLVPSELR